MNKNHILKITGIIAAALLAAVILAAVILLSLGYRFTSKSAVGSALADNPVIHTEEYDFYCINLDLVDNDEKVGTAIVMVCPIEKIGFLYKEVKNYEKKKVYIKGGANSYAGVLISFKGKDCYYNFFLRYALQQEILYNYDTIKINGKTNPVIDYSYFVSDGIVTEFELAGKILAVSSEK